MTALQQLHEVSELSAPDLSAADPIIERLRAGDIFVWLIEDQIEIRAAILAAILDQLTADPVKLVWTGNPLRSPLTIERLILQAAGPEADLRLERTPEQLARMLCPCADPETPRLVIVQQPETLDPIARESLARMQPHLAAATPRIQFLFCGTSAFHPIEPLPPEPALQTALTLREPPPGPVPDLPATSSRRGAIPLFLLLAATTTGSFWPIQIRSSDPSPQVATQVATQAAASQSVVDIAFLHREFDQFLASQPSRVSALTPDQRNALFQEYLDRTQRPPPSSLTPLGH